MSANEEAQPVKPHAQAANNGVDIVLSEDELVSLTSFFDVLIQADLEYQGNERNGHGSGSTDDTRSSKNSRKALQQNALREDKARNGTGKS